MNNSKINKELIIKSITKMVADKNSVRYYKKSTTTIETLTQKGIQLAEPF